MQMALNDTHRHDKNGDQSPRGSRWREWGAAWRRFSGPGVLTIVLVGVIAAAGMVFIVPARPQFAPSAVARDLLEQALLALDAGDYARAYHWLKRLDTEMADDPDLTADVAQMLIRGQLIAGYEAGIGRNALATDERADLLVDLVVRAVADNDDTRPYLNLFRPQTRDRRSVQPVADRALRHLLMAPSLRGIARTAVGLAPTPRPGEQKLALGAEETHRRLHRWFEFVRDTVAVIPDNYETFEIQHDPQGAPGAQHFFDFRGHRYFATEENPTGDLLGPRGRTWLASDASRGMVLLPGVDASRHRRFAMVRSGASREILVEGRWWTPGNRIVYVSEAGNPIPEPMRYPLDTLYDGRGRLSEVNWLLIAGMQELADVAAVELELAPPSLWPMPSPYAAAIDATRQRTGGEESPIPPAAALPVTETVSVWNPGPGKLVVALALAHDAVELYAFDAFAGVPLLDETGHLLDLFACSAGNSRLHPDLTRILPYGGEMERIWHGRCNYYVNPLIPTPLGATLQRMGLNVAPRVVHRLIAGDSAGATSGELADAFVLLGPSPLAQAFPLDEFGLRNVGHLPAARMPLSLDGSDELTVMVTNWGELLGAVVQQMAMEGAIPPAHHPHRASQFPHRWRFAWPAESWWLVREMQAEWRHRYTDVVRPDLDDATQRAAIRDNRLYRQRAFDYRRPTDGAQGYEQFVNERFSAQRWWDTAFPPAEEKDAAAPALPPIVGHLVMSRTATLSADPPAWRFSDAFVDGAQIGLVQLVNEFEARIRFTAAQIVDDPTGAFAVYVAPHDLPEKFATAIATAVNDGNDDDDAQWPSVWPMVVVFAPERSERVRATLRVQYVAGPGATKIIDVPLIGDPAAGHPVLGLPGLIGGSALTMMAESARRRLPVAMTANAWHARAVQAWYGSACAEFLSGHWELAAMSASDFLVGYSTDPRTFDLTRLPSSWRIQARFLRGRALQALDRAADATHAFSAISLHGPLGVAARVPHLLLPPTVYVSDH